MSCEASKLTGVELFELLSEEDRAALAAVVDCVEIEAGKVLFEAGDPGESLFVVRSGEVELFIRDNTGQKIVLTTATTGDLFGELALLDQGARTATALTLADGELLELDRDDLLLLFQRHPESAIRMLAAVTGMMRRADELLRTRVSRNVNEEVAEQLTPLQKVADWIAWFSGSMPFPDGQRGLVRSLDRDQHDRHRAPQVRSVSIRPPHDDRLARSNLSLMLRPCQSEQAGRKRSRSF